MFEFEAGVSLGSAPIGKTCESGKKCESVGMWECGSVGIWECGSVGVRECRNVGVWECGSVGMWGNVGV